MINEDPSEDDVGVIPETTTNKPFDEDEVEQPTIIEPQVLLRIRVTCIQIVLQTIKQNRSIKSILFYVV